MSQRSDRLSWWTILCLAVYVLWIFGGVPIFIDVPMMVYRSAKMAWFTTWYTSQVETQSHGYLIRASVKWGTTDEEILTNESKRNEIEAYVHGLLVQILQKKHPYFMLDDNDESMRTLPSTLRAKKMAMQIRSLEDRLALHIRVSLDDEISWADLIVDKDNVEVVISQVASEEN